MLCYTYSLWLKTFSAFEFLHIFKQISIKYRPNNALNWDCVFYKTKRYKSKIEIIYHIKSYLLWGNRSSSTLNLVTLSKYFLWARSIPVLLINEPENLHLDGFTITFLFYVSQQSNIEKNSYKIETWKRYSGKIKDLK